MAITIRSVGLSGIYAGVAVVLALASKPSPAEPGETLQTPVTPMELPVEIEIELSPAGSLKQAPLWKELYQMLENPYEPVERRPGFGVTMPPLNVWPLDYNFLTGQPLRLRTSDGEISWDLPGPMFDPDETVATDEFNAPTELRSIIGALVACPLAEPVSEHPYRFGGPCDEAPDGSLVVSNPNGRGVRRNLGFEGNFADSRIPPHRTVVAISAVNSLGQLLDEDGEPLTELEAPINEEDFFREEADVAGVPEPLQEHVGRLAAEVLGKSLFWDMQVGSDGVQACGSCHFHAGVDSRTRNQLNPGVNAGDMALEFRGPNEDVQASDFPFHKRVNPDVVGDGTDPAIVISDSNDVMSSMGVSEFKLFNDIVLGASGFSDAFNGVQALLPDDGTPMPDPVAVFDGLRRVEPRNTPTFHGAAFNFDNFWDGRARFNFNGGSVFGPSDPQFHIFIAEDGELVGATNGHINDELAEEDPEAAVQPVRIKFSSLGSQAMGPPLSEFEMAFLGRNWPKIAKKLLQDGVTPLANQLVAVDDSRLGPFSNQGGSICDELGRPTAIDKPGLCVTYPELIEIAFTPEFWEVTSAHLAGAECDDPFDAYCLTVVADAAADPADTNQFTQMEANLSLFFGLAVQAYESLTIPDDSPADRFFDANPFAGHGVGEPGDQAVLFPTLVPDLMDDGQINGSVAVPTTGELVLIPDDPSTPEYDGFGPDELYGFDIFAGANLTAALPAGHARNPIHTITTEGGQELQVAVGSNPFTRSAKCMLCHLGAEQTDHSINVAHGLLKNDAEFEFPTPPQVADSNAVAIFLDGLLPAPEPSGTFKAVGGLILSEEITEGAAQDAVEVEPRNFATFDDPATPWDDRVVAQPSNFAFGDQGVYNIGLRPTSEDIGRGGDDPFGWPLSLAALTLKNIGGQTYEPCDTSFDSCVMANFDPFNLEATFEETGDGAMFPGTTHTLQSINPGFERSPSDPQLPEYMVPWIHGLPAGELHPQIDEMAGMAPNTLTPPNGGPGIEFPEVLFGADLHCGRYDPALFGSGPPNFGWGPGDSSDRVCPTNQSGVAGNMDFPVHGTWPVPNRVLRDGGFKAPPLRNVELTGPYFHTGSYLTLRQVVDFYMRGGDFPLTNAESRDPNINDLMRQSFSFGRTNAIDGDFDALINFGFLQGYFADALPDTVYRYDAMPDTDHPITPEYATPEDAKVALVKFLLSLTDPRVKYERAPFDHPEIFVPIDGAAPENTGGREQLVNQSGVPCPAAGSTGECFRQIPAVGAGGKATPVPGFLGVTNNPAANCTTEISHFCR
ncbi:hypothetical protein ACNKU7_06020 [Microbulbifer sp. SA54]|uniref:hypothetical protein n=1 Tax=Microbulbifer sp. SA54 TaxID=3401577 RepID=UPI003AAAC028